MPFILTENRIAYVQEGQLLAEATFPEFAPGVVNIDHTFVDEALRGQGVAAQMMERIARSLRETGRKAIPTCSYAKKMVRPASGICRRASLNAHTQNAPSLKRTSALGKARFLFYFSGSRFRAARISRSSKEAMLSE